MKHLDVLRFFSPVADGLDAVERELERLLQSQVPIVEKLAAHARGGRGKRLRPALLLLAAKCAGYQGPDAARFGAVFELTHMATLVHDDVIDHAQLRRGKPTLNRIWGNTLTVLFGDYLYIQAMASAIQGRNWRLMEILADVTTRMIEGEVIQNDVLFKMDTTRDDYFEIQERKTALLFSGCTESAAVLAGRGPDVCEAFRQYGLEIGRAFQLTDDLLDFTASSEQLGKPAFSDLREGKLTLPMLTLLDRAPDEARPLIRTIWGRGEEVPIPEHEEQRLRALLEAHDVLTETRELARVASSRAISALEGLDGDAAAKGILLEIPGELLKREK